VLLIPGVDALFFQKTNFKMSKYLRKNISMYISMLYVLTQSLAYAKKDKNSTVKRLMLAPNFVFLYRHIKNQFFLKQLRDHVRREHAHITFLFDFLTFLNMLKINFK
jgi:hypothetical protein